MFPRSNRTNFAVLIQWTPREWADWIFSSREDQSRIAQGWKITQHGVPINSSADDFGMTFAGTTEDGQKKWAISHPIGIWRAATRSLEFRLAGISICIRRKTCAQRKSRTRSRLNIVGDGGETAPHQRQRRRQLPFQDEDRRQLPTACICWWVFECKRQYFHVQREPSWKWNIHQKFHPYPYVQIGETHNIYYDFDRATLRPESKEGLDAIIDMMNENQNITIEMSAHTDYKGNDEYNRVLSHQRAQAVIDYLINAGIDGARPSAVGYGEMGRLWLMSVTTNCLIFCRLARSWLKNTSVRYRKSIRSCQSD